MSLDQTRAQRAPQRPRTRDAEVVLAGHPLDRSNPGHPAGVDAGNTDLLLELERYRRGRHSDSLGPGTAGGKRWPLR